MSQVETFTNYGKAFQSKTIVCLIKDKLFIQQIMDILETKYFESDSEKDYKRAIRFYKEKYYRIASDLPLNKKNKITPGTTNWKLSKIFN